jgi:hypothetical protein
MSVSLEPSYPQVSGGPLLWTFAVNLGLHLKNNPNARRAHCGPLTVVLCKKHRGTAPNLHVYNTTPPRRDPRIF